MCDLIPIPNEFDDANDFWLHPVYDNWEANRLGAVRHVKNKKNIGNLEKSGYLRILVSDNGKRKHYLKHRFIYECFHGLITNTKLVVDHINNIKTDNRLNNLQLTTHSQNQIKENKKGKNNPPISVRATNIDTGESSDYYGINETSDYDSINKCSNALDIDRSAIRKIINGINETSIFNKYI